MSQECTAALLFLLLTLQSFVTTLSPAEVTPSGWSAHSQHARKVPTETQQGSWDSGIPHSFSLWSLYTQYSPRTYTSTCHLKGGVLIIILGTKRTAYHTPGFQTYFT